MNKFTHLNVKSHGSFQTASIKVADYVKILKERGDSFAALNDHGNVFNAIHFYKACTKANIKPILGVDVNFCVNNEQARIHKDRKTWSLVLLAENNTGWKNICRMISEANEGDNFYFKNRVDFEMLEKYSEGVIVLTGNPFDGLIASHMRDHYDKDGNLLDRKATFKASAFLRKLIGIFGKENVFVELQNHGYDFEKELLVDLRDLAVKNDVQCVATNGVYYLERSNAESHATLYSMGHAHARLTKVDFSKDEFYLKAFDEMSDLGFTPEELENSNIIAERCNVTIDLSKRRLPKYKFLDDGESSKDKLRELAEEGFNKLMLSGSEYEDRLYRELADIHEMGFDDYFLIVWDVCSWIHSQGIPLGRGRGSAGGSLVSYCLGITSIDPIKYNLFWERFLNKGRGGLPDIDTDVPRSRRKEVLGYIQERFGSDSVAQIVTFNGMKTRAILKEVFNVYGMPFDEANAITKLIPLKNEDHSAITLDQAIAKVPKLQEYEEKYRSWFMLAKELEGCYKSLGTHAAAVVISDTPFQDSDYPLCRAADGNSLIFGYDMGVVDSLSLLKLDILGLNTLDDVSETIKLVEQNHGIKIDRDKLPLANKAAYELIGEGLTVGLFQIEKQLGKVWSKILKPENIEELAALISLIRPGTLDSGETDKYSARKRGLTPPNPPDKSLEDILKNTLGIMVYQEQQIAAAKILTGWDLAKCDLLRRAIGKKKIDEIGAFKDDFAKAAKSNGFSEEVISSVWNVIEKSAGYSFNLSHAVGYGLLAYETAYLKANFPLEFFCAKLRTAKFAQDTSEEINILVNDAKLFDIDITPPRLSHGNIDFDISQDKSIAFGLSALKGVGVKAMEKVTKLSKKISSPDSFVFAVTEGKVNKTTVEALIKGGAIDDLGEDRVRVLAKYRLFSSLTEKERLLVREICERSNYNNWIKIVEGIADEDKIDSLKDKFGSLLKEKSIRLPNSRRRESLREIMKSYYATDLFDSRSQNISWEIHYLGISLSGNPADIYNSADDCKSIKLYPSPGRKINLAATINQVREIVTKKGDPMAFVTAGDDTYMLDNIVVFPRIFEQNRNLLEIGSVIRIRGKMDDRGSILVDELEKLK